MTKRAQNLEWERRWRLPVAIITVLGVLLIIAYWATLRSLPSGKIDAEFLRAIHADETRNVLGSVLEALALVCLTAPLIYLFRASLGRMPTMKSQLLGAVIISPIFLGAAAIVHALSLNAAATDFLSGAVPANLSAANEAASDAASNESLQSFAGGLYTAGALGFAFSMIYTCLFCQRTGLLTRFWGTLGMATGVLTSLFGPFPFAALWFAYIALLILGRIPSGRPPAWEAGESIPWPTPGEQVAAEMDPRGKPDYVEGEGTEIRGEPVTADEPETADEPAPSEPDPTSARELGEIGQKRKRRGR